jgi:hypothetical protein
MLNLYQKLIGLAVTVSLAVGGYFYVQGLRSTVKEQSQKIEKLEATQKITKREQEATDRIEIELNTYRNANQKAALGLNDVLAQRLRDNCRYSPAPESTPSVERSAAPDRPAGTVEESSKPIDYDALSAVCTISAQESNRYRREVMAWQEWYAGLQKSRNSED